MKKKYSDLMMLVNKTLSYFLFVFETLSSFQSFITILKTIKNKHHEEIQGKNEVVLLSYLKQTQNHWSVVCEGFQ